MAWRRVSTSAWLCQLGRVQMLSPWNRLQASRAAPRPRGWRVLNTTDIVCFPRRAPPIVFVPREQMRDPLTVCFIVSFDLITFPKSLSFYLRRAVPQLTEPVERPRHSLLTFRFSPLHGEIQVSVHRLLGFFTRQHIWREGRREEVACCL